MSAVAVVSADDVIVPPREYCNGESFVTRCPQHEVVVMTSATYGRMQTGRCVQHDLGFLGCQSDVIERLDDKCSGRDRCAFPVTNHEVMEVEGCLKELQLYLNASYKCLSGKRTCSARTSTCTVHVTAIQKAVIMIMLAKLRL